MLPLQLAFYACKAMYAAARGGVGSGKTMAMVWWMITRVTKYPRANHVVVGADYDQLRRGFFASLVGVLEEDLRYEPGKDFWYRETPSPQLRLASGARIRAMSAEIAQRARSMEIQTLYLEEPQTWHQGNGSETYKVIMDRLRFSKRVASLYPDMPLNARMTFNPPAVGTWLYKVIEEVWKAAGYPCFRFSLADNYLLRKLPEYIARVKMNNPPERWPTEIDGHWSTIGGDVYRGFDLTVHGAAHEDMPPIAMDVNRPICWALDFNVDYMASVVCQIYTQPQVAVGIVTAPGKMPQATYDRKNPKFQPDVIYCLEEIFLHDAGVPNVLDAFIARHGEHARRMGVYVYGDPAGGARAATMDANAAARSPWLMIMEGLRANDIPFTMCVRNAPPSQFDRVTAVQTQFNNGLGVGFLMNPVTCPELVTDFQTVQWVPGKMEIDKRDRSKEGLRRTHLSDAIGYMIDVHRRVSNGYPPKYKDFMSR